ncbi:MAG: BrnT family toxin [Chloroflexi bacterium]|nr:BrnT family toxin [Chloroflexota bacterium]
MKITALDWDDNNVMEIAKHGVTPTEVEDVCYGAHFCKKDSKEKSKGRDRYILSGQTAQGRYLDVVIERKHGSYFRAVTGFDMSEKYKRSYKKILEKKAKQ